MIGLPLTIGFISKYLFATAAFSTGTKLIPTLVVLALSTILNTFYFARTVIRLCKPPEGGFREKRSSSGTHFAVSAAAFIVINLIFGVSAQPVLDMLRRGLELL